MTPKVDICGIWECAPPKVLSRKLQSETYTGPITISKYQRFKFIRDELAKEGFQIGLPTGN